MRMLDLFSGIGGFHKGFEQAGYEFEWVGFSEIDKYASAVYKHRFPNAKELGDISAIRPERDLPDHIDILCGGFPCQAFSMAGKRKGFDDTRGTLFFEIARLLRHYINTRKPIDYFVLENVKGLLSHDNGRTFAVIYGVLTDLGYTVECQLLNTKWVLPQNRERIYIVGHIGRGSRAKVFPITEDDKRNYEEQLSRTQAKGQGQGMQHTQDRRRRSLPGDGQVKAYTERSFDGKREDGGRAIREHKTPGESPCLTSQMGMGGNNVPMVKAVLTPNRLEKRQNGRRMKEDGEPMFTLTGQDQHRVMVKEATSKGYAVAQEGDSINFCNPNSKTRRGRVGKGIAQTLDTGMEQATIHPNKIKILDDYNSKIREDGVTPTLTQNSGSKAKRNGIKILGNLKGQGGHECHNVHSTKGIAPSVRENHGKTTMVYNQPAIRRLTPIECERLQGFPDQWTSKGNLDGKVVDISDTQRYKQCGNAVSVPIVQLVARSIYDNLRMDS
jgi:DNA (cytosine-5)-methyltransferase 1